MFSEEQSERSARHAYEQRCRAMYELSQQPGFDYVIETLTAPVAARAPVPTSSDSRIAFETYSIMRETVESVLADLTTQIKLGEELERPEEGEPKNDEDGHLRGYRRA